MPDKELRSKSDKRSIDQFIDQAKKLPAQGNGQLGAQGRLIFALDATASREATWDQAQSGFSAGEQAVWRCLCAV